MLFNSYLFLLLFLPLCLCGYFLLNHFGRYRAAMVWLFGMSLWFYAANTPKYLFLIMASVLINFAFYQLSRRLTGQKQRKAAMISAVAVNLAILFYYKYFNFFVDTINTVFRSDWTLKTILLPLGISFFTFQQISFVVDAFRGEVPDYDFIDYACFVTFFPQLIAGPIVTHDDLVPQLTDERRKHFDAESFARGIYIFSMGLAKKVLIADSLSNGVVCFYDIVDHGFAAFLNSSTVLVAMLAYTLQMYFDFSGYSDMAIGIGKMFHIDLPQNFNSPYKAITIVDHWRRWHLTLTRFLTKYVYVPLGGSRRGAARTYGNILAVYFLSGIWHGAGWTYICWGLMHGCFNALTRWGQKLFDRIPKAVNWLITFAFINIGFIVFRSSTLSVAFEAIGRIFAFDFGPVLPEILTIFPGDLASVLTRLPLIGSFFGSLPVLCAFFLSLCMFLVLVPDNAYERMQRMRPTVFTLAFSLGLILWCLLSFGKVSEFLYFNF